MTERVAAILGLLAHKHSGSRFDYRRHMRNMRQLADLYRGLTPREVADLTRLVLDGTHPTAKEEGIWILCHLACLCPGSLVPFHEALVDQRIYWPCVIYHGADPRIARKLIRRLPGGDQLNHLLMALAWSGGEVVERAFGKWRASPPRWVGKLCCPPHRYAHLAGWELDADGRRRDLVSTTCHPLLPRGRRETFVRNARVLTDHEGSCPWCGLRLTTFLDLPGGRDLTPFPGRVCITACEFCSFFGTVFMKIGADGTSTWHGANEKSPHRREREKEFSVLPRGCLRLAARIRNPLESADDLSVKVQFSQVGGYPAWIQDSEYPACPDCRRTMPFLSQVIPEECETGREGTYYLFGCARCGVTATNYQQT